ncbi:MAG: hydroxysqualene dehydroxylase HpnE [Burkholderiaceae bacterium]|nr:hydroxysqualene dehydroxylase HpnE [Burkholderiaceae bacterium]
MANRTKRVAIVGGGWAGCAAAVELACNGCDVTLFEAARTLGGRARRVELDGLALDNGQHLLLGAYTESLRLMKLVGIDPETALLRLPLQMRYPPDTGGIDFFAPHLPAPLHLLFGLLRAKGMSIDDKLALARFFSAARWMGWQQHTDCNVAELLQRFDQTPRPVQLLWQPLCIAALNTPIEHASAQIFLSVLRDSLGARRAASDMLIPRIDLSALFPERAAVFVESHGGKVLHGKNVRQLARAETGWIVEAENFDAVVIATQAVQATDLLDGLLDTAPLAALAYEPITTCYLRYAHKLKLAQPFFALRDDPDSGKWGQFVFDRGQANPKQAGLLAVVVSSSGNAIAAGQETLGAAIAQQLADELQQPELAQPQSVRIISERRATFACTPALARPGNATGVDTLVLAGDYTRSTYPATLEAAVRSGIQAATLLLK